jgi:hypothetical protein
LLAPTAPLPPQGGIGTRTDPCLRNPFFNIQPVCYCAMLLPCHPEERGICGSDTCDCCDLLYCWHSFAAVVSTDSSCVAMPGERRKKGCYLLKRWHSSSCSALFRTYKCATQPAPNRCSAAGHQKVSLLRSFRTFMLFCSTEVLPRWGKEKRHQNTWWHKELCRTKARVCAVMAFPWGRSGWAPPTPAHSQPCALSSACGLV